MTIAHDGAILREVIFESSRLRIIRQDFGTPVVFVTFNELGLVKHGTYFWGFELFAKERISSIGIVTAEPNWYPPGEMSLAIKAINLRTSGCRVITYGHSQGGYGALKFAACLRASTAIAFCPQWSISPQSVGAFDSRYGGYFNSDWAGGLPIEKTDMAENNYIFYDPRDSIDNRHKEIIQSLKSTREIKVPLSGHETVRLIAEGGVSSEFIQTFAREVAPLASDLRFVLRKARGRSKTYRSNLLAALLKQAHLRRRCLENIEAAQTGEAPVASLCHALERGDFSAASRLLRLCKDEDLFTLGAVNVWALFRRTKFAEGESRLADALVKTYPRDGFLRLHAVNSLIELGRHVEARRELMQLIAQVDISHHMEHIRSFAASINKVCL